MKTTVFGRFGFILPAVVCFGFFIVFGIVFNFYISFTNWNGIGGTVFKSSFVGLRNYIAFINSPDLGYDVINAFFWSIFFLTVPVLLGLMLAIFMTTDIKGKNLFKAIFYYPQVLSGLVAALIWSWMFAAFTGVIPNILSSLKLDWITQYIFSFNTQWASNGTIALVALWQSSGFSMVLFLAGLASINPNIIEIARTDGAGRFALYRSVVIPMLRPFLVIIVVFAITNALRFFDLIFAFTQGGPLDSTQTFGLTMWLDAFRFNYYGEGAAVANILFVLTAVITIVYLRYYLKSERGIWVK